MLNKGISGEKGKRANGNEQDENGSVFGNNIYMAQAAKASS